MATLEIVAPVRNAVDMKARDTWRGHVRRALLDMGWGFPDVHAPNDYTVALTVPPDEVLTWRTLLESQLGIPAHFRVLF